MTTLEARGVVAGYGTRAVLHGVDIELRSGELVAIVGPNGAGKSTLLRALAGLLAPIAGAVSLDGTALATLSRAAVARRIAVVPQIVELLFPFTVEEIVALGRTAHLGWLGVPSAKDRASVDAAVAELDLAPLRRRRIDTLSGGERQRALLAMAIAQQADVLLLDEPTVHLDPAHQRATLLLVRDLARRRGLAAAAVLHDLNLAVTLADRAVVLADGRAVADGRPIDVLDQPTLDAVFGVGLRVIEAGAQRAIVPLG
jgi:iron complex transport system ATP-binding protein